MQKPLNPQANLEFAFNNFIDNIGKLVSHNYCVQNSRNSLLTYTSEAQHLFPGLLSTVNGDNISALLVSGTENFPTIQGPLPFLKLWKPYAKLCCDLQFSIPDIIKQSITRNFEIISTSLSHINKNQSAQSGGKKNVQPLIQQKISLLSECYLFLQNPSDTEQLQSITSKIKSYSKILNDCFVKEFNDCGISSKDLVRIRQKVYTACSDTISIINSIIFINIDIKNMLNSLDRFQEALLVALDHSDASQSAIYRRPMLPELPEEHIPEQINLETNEEEETEELDFKSFNNAYELMDYGIDNAKKLKKSEIISEFLKYLKELVSQMDDDNKNTIKSLQKSLKDFELKSQTELLVSENKRKELMKKIEEMNNLHSDDIKNLRNIISSCYSYFENQDIDESVLNSELHMMISMSISKFNNSIVNKDQSIMKIFEDLLEIPENIDIYSYMVSLRQEINKKIENLSQSNAEKEETKNNQNEELKQKIYDLQNEFDERIKSLTSKISNLYQIISDKFKDFINVPKTGSFFEDSVEACDLMVHTLKKENERNAKCEKILGEVRDRLAKYLKIEVPSGDFDSSSLRLIEILEKMQNPLQSKLENSDALVNALTKALLQIKVKLKLGDTTAEQQLKGHVLAASILKDVSTFSDNVDLLKKSFLAYRDIIIKYNDKAAQFVGLSIDNEHYRNMSEPDFVSFSQRLCNGMVLQVKPKVDKSKLTNEGINKIFEEVFKNVEISNKTQPMVYLPELSTLIMTMNNTLSALKPFAAILNEIFSQFDCKLRAFSPVSAQYKMLRQNVMKIHAALSAIVPSKINSLVFLVLSRFVALLSSLLSALSTLSFGESDIDSKEEIFKIQQENIKLNNLLNEHNNV
ncbi:hypothetical protein TVAG_071430 [Trichomonas vaginalis G3]|uniref:Uncharacterized protein n=1 Tax=Trichomonas vaginalis (strain ATCC PRA-98 / G3) TaxID=412133 RepID=A2D846_TRIV3|nr:WD40 repeat-containing protein [Trichomonas vaginalis G3]EAY23479.1 hypothetical protein TVAG_071430 [Trichomonas vaginalis G3]KAI5493896.1 WD40 repeat-containing protein [Trichomonas vaginalis G3]|eukprot:XP_001584465.1 hypothetical protein [Trichomonas vaginalis G3]